MRVNKINFKKFSHERTLRYDFDYHRYIKGHEEDYFTFGDLFEILPNKSVSIDDLYDDFQYCEIRNVNKLGDISPVNLNFNNRNLLDENYYKKIEKGDIVRVEEGDILISKVRPNLKKYVFVNGSIKDVYFTSAFLRIKPLILPNIIYHCLRNVFYENLIAVSRQGKGYPTINEIDISYLRFNKKIIDKLCANESGLTSLIEKNEEAIAVLKRSSLTSQQIIDSVFQHEFGIDLEELTSIDKYKIKHIPFEVFTEKNINCRFSYRWNKAVEIQRKLITEVQSCEKLGLHITATQNGWSPPCSEEISEYQVLGLDAIDVSGILSFENPKYSSVYKKNFEKFLISDGDFFVSRGNTTELVSLASIASINEDTTTTIFPDLMIKISFDDLVNKMYMAYAINSFIGRLYFKYSTKGKNQTMVKVSPRELSDFYVPIPEKETQEKIVNRIQAELIKQDEIKEKIAELRNQIDISIINIISK